jgi:membrane associated rhomboid family serine protease
MIPYATDAPIYHYPIATIGLIVVNVVVFFGLASSVDPEAAASGVEGLMLQFGTIAPWQWLTSNFLHAGLGHLVGNMIFLWAFGLVVEGKIGWWRFLTLYLVIGMLQAAIIQSGMFLLSDRQGVALGASAAIYGLMGLAVAWAPKNELQCVMWLYFPRFFEISILMFGLLYLSLQLMFLFLQHFQMSSELLHIVGLAIGLPLGLVMVKLDWVDCEGWDLFSVWSGDTGRKRVSAAEVAQKAKSDEADLQSLQRQRILRSMREAMSSGNATVAAALCTRQPGLFDAQHPVAPDLLMAIVNRLHQQRQWEASVAVMQLLLEQSTAPQVAVRLKLAQILLQVSHKPRRALKILAALPAGLPPAQETLRAKLVKLADESLAADDSEFEIADDGG